jgi:hypothetical protein
MRIWAIPLLLLGGAVSWFIRRMTGHRRDENFPPVDQTYDVGMEQSTLDGPIAKEVQKGRLIRISIHLVGCILLGITAVFFYRIGTATPSEHRRPGFIGVFLSQQSRRAYNVTLDVWVSNIFAQPEVQVNVTFGQRKDAPSPIPPIDYAILVAGTADGVLPAYVGRTISTSVWLDGWCAGPPNCRAPAHVTTGTTDLAYSGLIQFSYKISKGIVTRGASTAVVRLPKVGQTADLEPDPKTFEMRAEPSLQAGLPQSYFGADHDEVSVQAAPLALDDDIDKIDPVTTLDAQQGRLVWTLKNVHPKIPKLIEVLNRPRLSFDGSTAPAAPGPVPIYDSPPKSPLPLEATFRVSRQPWKDEAQNNLFYAGIASAVSTGFLTALVGVFVDFPWRRKPFARP